MNAEPAPQPAPPALILIHGLGAASGVWAGLRAVLDWPGPVIALDLPGHGAAAWTDDYSLDAMAAAVSGRCEAGQDALVVGHSLGGAVGLCLASGAYRPNVVGAVGVGIKVNWSPQDVAGMAKVAAKGVRWFERQEEATARFLLQSGLSSLGQDHPTVAAALEHSVAEEDGRWRVAQDPATFAQQALDTARLVAAAACPVVLGAGADDQMVSRSDLAAYVPAPRIAAGRGHNVHVEDPAWVAGLIGETTATLPAMDDSIPAPFVGLTTEVRQEWIDYNGHLNAGYYFVVFDDSVTEFMDFVGLGRAHRDEQKVTTFSVEGHITFEREMRLGDPIEIRTQLLGWDAKKFHYINFMHHGTEGWVAATNELLSMHVSQETRRSAPMAPEVQARLAAIHEVHRAMPVPSQVGRVIGLNAGKAAG